MSDVEEKKSKGGQKRPSLIINAISNWASLLLNIVVLFFLTPFIIKHLGKEGYGIWAIIISIIGYYGLLDLGIRSAIIRYISLNKGKENLDELNRVISSAFFLFLAIGAIATVLLFLITEPILGFFKISGSSISEVRKLLWVISIYVGISFPANVLFSNIIAHEKFVAHNLTKVVTILIRLVFTIVVLNAGYGLVGIAWTYVAMIVVELLIYIILNRVLTPEVKISLKMFRVSTTKMLFSFGLKTFVGKIGDQLRFQLDSIVIGKILSLALVGVYRVAALIVNHISNLVTSATMVLIPRFSHLEGQQESKKLNELFLKSTTMASFIAFGLSMMVAIFGGQFIRFWVGRDFYEAVPVLWLLCAALALQTSQTPAVNIMYALNKHKFYAIITLIEGIVNLGLSILLAPRYGIMGVALGTFIPMLVIKILIQPVYVVKILKISLLSYTKRLVVPVFTALLITGGSWFVGILTDWERFSILETVLLGIGAGIAFLVLNYGLMSLLKINILKTLFEDKILKRRKKAVNTAVSN